MFFGYDNGCYLYEFIVVVGYWYKIYVRWVKILVLRFGVFDVLFIWNWGVYGNGWLGWGEILGGSYLCFERLVFGRLLYLELRV